MNLPNKPSHPKGEKVLGNLPSDWEDTQLDTFDGKIDVEWDPTVAVTSQGQMPFFIEFLKTADLFDSWVEDCPMNFVSNNASKKRDVLGTLLLSILAGHTRYAHITSLRNDQVNPALLGMTKVVSEDAARRGLKKIEVEEGCLWLEKHLKKSYISLLSTPWILDIDATVKTLFGHQEGAEVGYNPNKPGRPSHTYHTYHIANIRMVLDVEVEDGKSGAGCYSAPKLWNLLKNIPTECWPEFIRGDSSYGNEKIISSAEDRHIKYLFKLKMSKKIKELIAKKMCQSNWQPVGCRWEGIESKVKLSGWSEERRVILLRRPLPKDQIGITKKSRGKQLEFYFADVSKDVRAYEYQTLVTNLKSDVSAIAQHYRDRADCENNFDELKNQWGWSGYTTQDLTRCRLMAKSIALIYNWWTIFTRLANPDAHLEAITSRPLLLNAIAKKTTHAGKTKVTITSTHSKSKKVSKILKKISYFFSLLRRCAEQLSAFEKLEQILRIAFRKFMQKTYTRKLIWDPGSI